MADYEYAGEAPPVHDVLAKLATADSDVKQACASELRRLLEDRNPPRVEALVKVHMVLGGDLPDDLFRRRCVAALHDLDRFSAWWQSWLGRDQASAIRFLEEQVPVLPAERASDLVMNLCATLEWSARANGLTKISNEPVALASLLAIVYTYVSPADDTEQVGDAPDTRDSAQEFRGRLLRWLAETPGMPSAQALQQLAANPVVGSHRDWLFHLERQRVEADAAKNMPSVSEALVRLFHRYGLGAESRLSELSRR